MAGDRRPGNIQLQGGLAALRGRRLAWKDRYRGLSREERSYRGSRHRTGGDEVKSRFLFNPAFQIGLLTSRVRDVADPFRGRTPASSRFACLPPVRACARVYRMCLSRVTEYMDPLSAIHTAESHPRHPLSTRVSCITYCLYKLLQWFWLLLAFANELPFLAASELMLIESIKKPTDLPMYQDIPGCGELLRKNCWHSSHSLLASA